MNRNNVILPKKNSLYLTFIRLALMCAAFTGLRAGTAAAQPEAEGVVPDRRVPLHTRAQRPLLLLLYPPFLLLLLLVSLLGGGVLVCPPLGRRGGRLGAGEQLPLPLGVAVCVRRLPGEGS